MHLLSLLSLLAPFTRMPACPRIVGFVVMCSLNSRVVVALHHTRLSRWYFSAYLPTYLLTYPPTHLYGAPPLPFLFVKTKPPLAPPGAAIHGARRPAAHALSDPPHGPRRQLHARVLLEQRAVRAVGVVRGAHNPAALRVHGRLFAERSPLPGPQAPQHLHPEPAGRPPLRDEIQRARELPRQRLPARDRDHGHDAPRRRPPAAGAAS